MSDGDLGRTHEPSLREYLSVRLDGLENTLTAKFDGFRSVMEERDRRYQEQDRRYEERDQANKDALRAALASSEKAANATADSLREYKASANEWRDTVKDLIANLRESRSEGSGKSLGVHAVVAYIIAGSAILLALIERYGVP
jgi:hypothetical protein